MTETQPRKCVCGKYPKIEMKTSYSGGSRYKGKTRCDSWEAICEGKIGLECHQRSWGVFSSKEAVIKAWNREVVEAEERRDAPDKFIYDLENSSDTERNALGRILKELAEIKKELIK